MRVLWIAGSEGLLSSTSESPYNGIGWVAGLQAAVKMYGTDIELGLAFITHKVLPFKIENNGCSYYPVKSKKSVFEKVIDRIKWRDSDYLYDDFIKVINDFNPDIIHVFGVEMPYSYLVDRVNLPTVVHLQGFLTPYSNAYFPPKMNTINLLRYSKFYKELLGIGYIYDYYAFKHMTLKEKTVFSKCKNVMGRTLWDEQISDLMSNKAKYYHIDEVLRPQFYSSLKWKYKQNQSEIKIVTTISQTMYKGLDLILKTSALLKTFGIKYCWNVIGVHGNSDFVRIFEKQTGIKSSSLNIIFNGKKDADEIVDIILNSDLYIHPSYIDNSPNSLCEAQLLGIPVVACNVGGVSSLISDGQTGFLIPANAPYELVYIIKHYGDYSIDEISRKEIKLAEERHNRKNIVNALINCYTDCIKTYRSNVVE